MNKESYAMPVTLAEKSSFEKVGIAYAIANTKKLAIPTTVIDPLVAQGTDYDNCCIVTDNPQTQCPAATRARNSSWELLAPLLVDLYNKYFLNNDLISPADKATLMIKILSGSHSESEAQTTTPIVKAVSETESMLFIVYSDSASVSKDAKPDNVGFLEVVYKVGDPSPVTIADCTKSENISRSHQGIVFQPEQRGLNFYGFARWVNNNGKKGPWGNMFSNRIP